MSVTKLCSNPRAFPKALKKRVIQFVRVNRKVLQGSLICSHIPIFFIARWINILESLPETKTRSGNASIVLQNKELMLHIAKVAINVNTFI